MRIGNESTLRLNHISVVSLQSKVIYMFPCGHRKNKEYFMPGTNGPSQQFPIFPYLTTDLANFGQVFWKTFTQNIFSGNVCLSPFFGDDWSVPVHDRWIALMTVMITSSLLNMIMNETRGRSRVIRIGRDEIDFTRYMVVLEQEIFVFGMEAWLLGFLLSVFCCKEKYLLWHRDFPIDADQNLLNSGRRLVGYCVIFAANVYMVLIVLLRGSTMDKEQIEDWEWEVVVEIIGACFIFDPVMTAVTSLITTLQAMIRNRAPQSIWIPYSISETTRHFHDDWKTFKGEIANLVIEYSCK